VTALAGDVMYSSNNNEVTANATLPYSVVLVIILTTLMEAFTTQVSTGYVLIYL
jgi:hypothetical protein